MLKNLVVSRSGYRAFLQHKPSTTQQRNDAIKEKIKDIYDDSKQNYGDPKITHELRKSGETIAERTVGKYMKEMGIRAQWIKPWTTTTRDSDFSKELHNVLNEQFNPDRPNAVWCTDITYIWTLSDNMEVSCVINTINKAMSDISTTLVALNALTPDNKTEIQKIVDDTSVTTANLRKFSEKLNKRFLLFRLLF